MEVGVTASRGGSCGPPLCRTASRLTRPRPAWLELPPVGVDGSRPFAAAAELLCTIPGVQRRTAECVIAEIGTDMSQFPTAGHLASWAGQCPGNDQSAGKRRSGRTRKGSRWLNAALKDAAMAATRTNGSYLQALYRRKKSQLGHARALGAVKHSMICACSIAHSGASAARLARCLLGRSSCSGRSCSAGRRSRSGCPRRHTG